MERFGAVAVWKTLSFTNAGSTPSTLGRVPDLAYGAYCRVGDFSAASSAISISRFHCTKLHQGAWPTLLPATV